MGKTTVIPTPKEPQMWFIAGDWHYDQLDPACFSILIKHALSVPEKHRNLIINGDFVDLALFMPKNADFQTWVNRKDGIEMFFLPEYEKEVKWANDTLDALQSVFKKIIYVFGNHCKARVDFFLNNHCPEAYKPHYIKNSDVSWQNGYGTFTMKPNGNFNMNIHLVIDDELCLPNSEIIKG